MAYGWGTDEPVIDKPLEDGGDSIQSNALKLKRVLDALFAGLNQDMARASAGEAAAGTDARKIITPATAFRMFYGRAAPNESLGKNGDVFIQHGDSKNIWIKGGGTWQVIDAVPQAAAAGEVNSGQINTKYVTPLMLKNHLKKDLAGGFPALDSNAQLPPRFIPASIAVWDKSGTYKWKVPGNVRFVLVSGCGGGGGTNTVRFTRGGCGGSGGNVVDYYINVTPGTTYTITIGSGGKGGDAAGGGIGGGAAGGVTSLGGLLSLGGGKGGRTAPYNAPGVGADGARGSSPVDVGYSRGGGLFGFAGDELTNAGKGSSGRGKGSGGGGGYGVNHAGGQGTPGLLIVQWVV